MIVTIHGTHGSGKSTVVRRVMEYFPNRKELMRHPRRRPLGYILSTEDSPVPLFIPGHYETPCGGCDTISAVDDAYNLIRTYADNRTNVLFEGILAQHSTRNLLSLKPWNPVVLILNVSDDDAVAAVTQRRKERGDERPLNPSNIISENRSIKNRVPKLKDAGFDVNWVDRDEAVALCLRLLR